MKPAPKRRCQVHSGLLLPPTPAELQPAPCLPPGLGFAQHRLGGREAFSCFPSSLSAWGNRGTSSFLTVRKMRLELGSRGGGPGLSPPWSRSKHGVGGQAGLPELPSEVRPGEPAQEGKKEQMGSRGEEVAVGVRLVMPKPWCIRAAAHYPSQLSCRR